VTVATVDVDRLAQELVRLLGDLSGIYGELGMHMRNKVEAIKRADADQIQSITAREFLLADRAAEREGLRRQITQRILAGLGRAHGRYASLKLPVLAEWLAEPRRSQLLVAAAGLRERLEEIDRMRVTTTLITQEMLKHLGEVLSVMTSGGAGGDVYSRTGRREAGRMANVFEAVG
jgi:hypothetical protein